MITEEPRLLVLRGGAIGDFMMTLPALQALRTRWPKAHISLFAYPHVRELVTAAKMVNEFRSLEDSAMSQLFSSNPDFSGDECRYVQSFDVVLSYLHDPDQILAANMQRLGARKFIQGSPLVETVHAMDHLLQPLKELAITVPEARSHLRLDDALQQQKGRTWLNRNELHAPVLAIHPGSGSPKKNWPGERFIDLYQRACRRHWNPFFILGEADRAMARTIFDELPDAAILSGSTLVEAAAVLSVCEAYVGNDSGITHLASALERPMVALFGPTRPELWGPRGPHVTILRHADEQMASIEVDEVERALFASLN